MRTSPPGCRHVAAGTDCARAPGDSLHHDNIPFPFSLFLRSRAFALKARATLQSRMHADLAVQTTGLTRDFGSFRAVDGIDLAVPAGSFYGFLGPNGAGKSTTIKCLTGLIRPTAGSMSILGIDPLAGPVAVKRRIGVVPEDLALFDRLSAEETLSFVAQVHGIDLATARQRSTDLLEIMDL